MTIKRKIQHENSNGEPQGEPHNLSDVLSSDCPHCTELIKAAEEIFDIVAFQHKFSRREALVAINLAMSITISRVFSSMIIEEEEQEVEEETLQ